MDSTLQGCLSRQPGQEGHSRKTCSEQHSQSDAVAQSTTRGVCAQAHAHTQTC